MTVSKSSNNSDNIKQIINEVKFLYTKKIFILISILASIATGFWYHNLKSNQLKAEFQNTCSIRSNAVHAEIISDFLKSINDMGMKTKVNKLNLSIRTVEHIKKINPIVVPLSVLPSDVYTTNILHVQINYTNKIIYDKLLKGITYYINSQIYVKEKIEKYKKIRQKKIQLLRYIDNEVKKIDENKYQSMTNFQEYNDKNTADLYRLKQKFEAETIDPPTVDIIDKGVAIYTDGAPNLKIHLISFFLIGTSLSIGYIYLIEFLKKSITSFKS